MRTISEGVHTREAVAVLGSGIRSKGAMESIVARGRAILEQCIDPRGAPPDSLSDGLLFGLIQSGKTSILTITAALAADNGFDCILILTSDIDLLYDQTLERVRNALRGLQVMSKSDLKDNDRFNRQLRSTPIAVVCSKNGNRLQKLFDVFRKARTNDLAVLIIDDEADQASLNTYTHKGSDEISKINRVINSFREYFRINTYLQVTATPQALFLQRPDHKYRPSFTVLSEPGEGYIGGEAFFGEDSNVLRYVKLEEVDYFQGTNQPAPTANVPLGMRKALIAFLVGATSEIYLEKGTSYAFLCHVSIKKVAHELIVKLIDRFKEYTLSTLDGRGGATYDKLIDEFRESYIDLSKTAEKMAPFDEMIGRLRFYLRGAKISIINAESDEEIKLGPAFNIFVGGNKLGRGVTIRNLIVSYYGRNPKHPNSDTVLQHARMYGYRKSTLGVTRLFLPEKLAEHFRLIHQMESALRNLVKARPHGKFEGLFISPPLHATRRNVLDPNSIGMYIAGGSYNPRYPLRTGTVQAQTLWLDKKLEGFVDTRKYYDTTVEFLIDLLEKCDADPAYGYDVWEKKTIRASLENMKNITGNKAYIVVKRNRNLNEARRETQGIISGGEDTDVPKDLMTLFIYRQDANKKGEFAVWWPQLRFADGSYVLAFSFDK